MDFSTAYKPLFRDGTMDRISYDISKGIVCRIGITGVINSVPIFVL